MAKKARSRPTKWAAFLSVVLLIGLPAWGQTDSPPVSGPIVGFVADQLLWIRPILGLPGAAILGPPVVPNAGFRNVAISPARDYALVLLSRGHQVVLLNNLRSLVSAAELPVPPGAGRMAISPSGDAAVLYYPGLQSVKVLTGLPQSAAVSWSLELPILDGSLAALAVSDGGGVVVAATAGEPSSIWLLAPDNSKILSQVAASPSLAFLAGSQDVLIADGALSTVTLARDPTGQAQITSLGGPAEGVSRPVAVAASADKRRAFVANADPAGVVSLSLEGEQGMVVPCECTISGLQPLADGTSFRLNDPGEGPLWLLDAASSPLRIVFVPDQAPARPRLLRSPLPVRAGGER